MCEPVEPMFVTYEELDILLAWRRGEITQALATEMLEMLEDTE